MTVAELIVKLSAVGGDEVKRKLNETEKDLRKQARLPKKQRSHLMICPLLESM